MSRHMSTVAALFRRNHFRLLSRTAPTARRSSTARPTAHDKPARTWSTPLARQLAEAMAVTGPVPLASYMRMCLTSDVGGYYTSTSPPGRDRFGRDGDFVTSPDICQVFGELVALWFVAEWIAQGRPQRGVELIELGPGRGTLMRDVLETIRRFPAMAGSIDAVYMVEASAELREVQKTLLCGQDAAMSESEVGYHSLCSIISTPMVWTETIRSIPVAPSKMPFMLAHEFFDALPIHAFQAVSVASGEDTSATVEWRELLVSPTPADCSQARVETATTQGLDMPPEFQLTVARKATRHSLYLPVSSPRYDRVRSRLGADASVEICPDACLYASELAVRIGGSAVHPKPVPSGAALILDYGPDDGSVPTGSLRGIRRHRRVSPLAEPGLTDLSADVDFAAVAEAATRASSGVEVHGPVPQAVFLELMGVRERADMLSRALAGQPDRVHALEQACARLVDPFPDGMGSLYKALALVPENEGRRRPVGFGGDVVV